MVGFRFDGSREGKAMRLPLWAFGLGWVGLSAAIAGAGLAQEKSAAPAQKAEAVPGPFRMYVVLDSRYDPKDEQNRTGKLHDPIGEFGLAPGIAVFSRTLPMKPEGPLVTLISEQDRLAQKYKPLRLGAFVAFLTLTKDFPEEGDRDNRIAEVANFARQIKPAQVVIGVAEATVDENGKAAPSLQVAAWKIRPEDDLTVVFFDRVSVVGRWAFSKDKPPTAAEIDDIATVVDKHLAPKLAPKKK
jgi:hypothetical protein